jgi:hypothetical protein
MKLIFILCLLSISAFAQTTFNRQAYSSLSNDELFKAGRKGVGRCKIVGDDYYAVVIHGTAMSRATRSKKQVAGDLRVQILIGNCDFTGRAGDFDREYWIQKTDLELFQIARYGAGVGVCYIADQNTWFVVVANGVLVSDYTPDASQAGKNLKKVISKGQCDPGN